MYSTTDFRKNLKIEIDGEPFVIVSAQHVKPGKGVAFVKTRIKSLITGRVRDVNYRSGDKVGKPDLEEKDMEYLYEDPPFMVFMDSQTYEQVQIEKDKLEEVLPYLKENLGVKVLFHNGTPISTELPNFVELLVTQTDPGVKGDTAQGGSKPATLETGAVVQVPLYLNEGETIKVDTRTGDFAERVNN